MASTLGVPPPGSHVPPARGTHRLALLAFPPGLSFQTKVTSAPLRHRTRQPGWGARHGPPPPAKTSRGRPWARACSCQKGLCLAVGGLRAAFRGRRGCGWRVASALRAQHRGLAGAECELRGVQAAPRRVRGRPLCIRTSGPGGPASPFSPWEASTGHRNSAQNPKGCPWGGKLALLGTQRFLEAPSCPLGVASVTQSV